MSECMHPNNRENNSGPIFIIFSIWSFILLCRPQDYLSFLEALRPGLSLGLITMIIYFIGSSSSGRISSSKQFILYRYLIIVMIIGVPFSYYMSASLKDIIDYASITTMFFFLFYKIVNSVSKLLSLLFAYSTGVAIYGAYILKFGSFSDERISFGSMFDPNDTAFFFIGFLTFNLLFISSDNKGYKKIIAVINIALSLIVILKTGSRGGLISCSVLFAYLLVIKTNTVKLSLIAKTAIVIVAILSVQIININFERYNTILDLKEDYNVTGEEGRIALWQTGMRMMLSRPLTGVGMNRFNEGVGKDRIARGLASPKWQTAHNSLVQIGAETGIIGLIIFCLMSINVFKITGEVVNKSRSEELVKISEMSRAGFLGLFLSAMFLSQAYSLYLAFYIVLSAKLQCLLDKEANETGTVMALPN